MRIITLSALVLIVLALPLMARAAEPEDTLREHFAAISAKDFRKADSFFSQSFLRAFKGDVAKLNRYYLARLEQLERGYELLDPADLSDSSLAGRRLTVEFGPRHPEAPILITERLYYYLVRERLPEGDMLADGEGMGWRIEIFDSISFESLADARRRPYLYTREAWPEDEGRELKSRVGLFRIQAALADFAADNRGYPLRLQGEDSRRDELISAGFIETAYPLCGFAERSMRSVELGIRSSGDFSYYSVDNDGDGVNEGYWLLLHGKQPERFYFSDVDTIYILSSEAGLSQRELAERFAEFWRARGGREELALVEENWQNHIEPPPPMLADLLPASDPTPTGSISTQPSAEDMPASGQELIESLMAIEDEAAVEVAVNGEVGSSEGDGELSAAEQAEIDAMLAEAGLAAEEVQIEAPSDSTEVMAAANPADELAPGGPVVSVSPQPHGTAKGVSLHAGALVRWIGNAAGNLLRSAVARGPLPLTVRSWGFED